MISVFAGCENKDLLANRFNGHTGHTNFVYTYIYII